MCLWTIFRVTFPNSLPVVDNRLIERKVLRNFGSLPGFGNVNCLQRYSSAKIRSKTLLFYCCVRVRFRGKVFIEPLLINGLHNPVVLLLRAHMLRALSSNGRCLQTHRLTTGLYATILSPPKLRNQVSHPHKILVLSKVIILYISFLLFLI
jgi:hypothetical protein